MKLNKSLNSLAYLISVIFHPIFIPIYFSILVFFTDYIISNTLTLENKFLIIVILIFNFLIMPISLTAIWLKIRYSRINMNTILSERIASLLVFGITYFGIGLLLLKLQFNFILAFIGLTASIICFIIVFITTFIKISIHVTSWAALLTWILILMYKTNYDFSIIIIVVMLITGIVAWSRKVLEAHTNTELTLSYIIGFVVSIFLSYI